MSSSFYFISITGDNSSSTKPPHKAYGITNIETYVPLILDLTARNYEPWSDLFQYHCIEYDMYLKNSSFPPTLLKQRLSRYNVESTTMQLENEFRNITLGDSTIHEYFKKIKKITDLLEGLGEKMKDRNVVLHALNDLLSNHDTVAGVICFSKLIPTFSEMRYVLLVAETRINYSCSQFCLMKTISPLLPFFTLAPHPCRRVMWWGRLLQWDFSPSWRRPKLMGFEHSNTS
uniref:Uncharacterized protein n=1 Tax=Lactuca sativa TaxID=4236 RepID=A0A9R1UPY1_LACSA|nr:hypothetical protein LSAT_V11C800423930 [Lactuca sativa]